MSEVVITGYSPEAAGDAARAAERRRALAVEAVRLGVSLDEPLGLGEPKYEPPSDNLQSLLRLPKGVELLSVNGALAALCEGQIPTGLDDDLTRIATSLLVKRMQIGEEVFAAILKAASAQATPAPE